MKRVGLITDDSHLRHYSSTYHPERPERITSIQESLTRLGIMESLIPVNVQPADNAQLALIHTQELIESIRDRCGKGAGWIDSDTYYTPDSFEAARRSAGLQPWTVW
jgi:acetoin utilization deacetylase AcuC-like enzyme